jgi:hypothetical protein
MRDWAKRNGGYQNKTACGRPSGYNQLTTGLLSPLVVVVTRRTHAYCSGSCAVCVLLPCQPAARKASGPRVKLYESTTSTSGQRPTPYVNCRFLLACRPPPSSSFIALLLLSASGTVQSVRLQSNPDSVRADLTRTYTHHF